MTLVATVEGAKLNAIRLGVTNPKSLWGSETGQMDFLRDGRIIARLRRRGNIDAVFVEGEGVFDLTQENVRFVGHGPWRRIRISDSSFRAPFHYRLILHGLYEGGLWASDYVEDDHYLPALLVERAKRNSTHPAESIADNNDCFRHFDDEYRARLEVGDYSAVLDDSRESCSHLRELVSNSRDLSRLINGHQELVYP